MFESLNRKMERCASQIAAQPTRQVQGGVLTTTNERMSYTPTISNPPTATTTALKPGDHCVVVNAAADWVGLQVMLVSLTATGRWMCEALEDRPGIGVSVGTHITALETQLKKV